MPQAVEGDAGIPARMTAGLQTRRLNRLPAGGPHRGAVKTNASDCGPTKFARCSSSRHITERAILFLASPLAAYVTGVVLPADGGWSLGGASTAELRVDAQLPQSAGTVIGRSLASHQARRLIATVKPRGIVGKPAIGQRTALRPADPGDTGLSRDRHCSVR